MAFFDWGLFKPWGGIAFVFSIMLYGSAIWGAGVAWWRGYRITESRFTPVFLALCVVGGMVVMAGGSLLLQTTSVRHQAGVHFSAVLAMVIGIVLSKLAEIVILRKADMAP